MSEHTSERTPESNGPRAIEDIQPEHGALVRPSGPPTTLGPQAQVNPFWSETQRDEAILRACRPSHLCREIPEVAPPSVTAVSPPREAPDAVGMMVHGLLQENARLWSEREVAGPGGWGQHVMPFGSQQSMLGGVKTPHYERKGSSMKNWPILSETTRSVTVYTTNSAVQMGYLLVFMVYRRFISLVIP